MGQRVPISLIALGLRATAAATFAAAITGFALGARNPLSLLIVAGGFGLCSGIGLAWAARTGAI
jgi:hypothetical protein